MKANKSNFKLDNLNLILSFLFLIGGICFIVIFYNNIFDITPTKYSCNSQYFNSNNPDEIFNISECYLNNSEINQSIDVLNNAIKHGVINLDIFLSLAGQYYEQVDFDSAKKVYEYAKKEYPNSPRLYDKIGNLHKPDVMIFLDVPAEVCISRIESRGEDKQVHETTEKLTRLRDAYLLICDVLAEQAHIIDGNRPLVDVVADATKVVRNEN